MKCIELLPSFVVIYPRNWCQYTKSCHKFKSFKISYFKQKLCISKFTLYMGQILFSSYIVHLKSAFFLMNARAYQREEAEMILSKSRDINVVFTLFNSVHYFTYMLRNYSTVFLYVCYLFISQWQWFSFHKNRFKNPPI